MKDKALLSMIMRRAHATTRKTVAQYPGTDYRATFAAALQEAWANHRALQNEARAAFGDEMVEAIARARAARLARRQAA